MSEYVVPIAGGLGDVFLRYLLPGACGYVADLRKQEPGAQVRCRLMTTNPLGCEFLASWFDEVIYEPWDGDYRAFQARTANGHINPAKYRWARPPITLSPKEQELVKQIGACVVLHPYAGTSNRAWDGLVDLAALIDRLCDSGRNVVLLGGNSIRTEGDFGRVTSSDLVEEFDYQRPGFVNMVNGASVRLQAYMAMKAHRFVGSFSCYHCAAFAVEARALVLAPAGFRGFFGNRHPVYGVMAERPCTQIRYFEDGAIADRILEFATGD